jgi:hypothetical protein
VKLADYSGKIRLIMLHKPEVAGPSTCFASKACDTSSILAIDPGIGVYSLESFPTPDASVNHFMAVKSVTLKQFVAVLEYFSCKMSKQYSLIGVYQIPADSLP